MTMKGRRVALVALLACALITVALEITTAKGRAAATPRGYSPAMQAKIKEMQAKLDRYAKDEATVRRNLQTFDTLDFVVFSGQEWVRLHESHSADVVVNWPDGHHTNGIERHIADLKALFVYAPDTRIRIHPVRFGAARGVTGSALDADGKIQAKALPGGEGFTCVTGVMEGTFTKPMPIGDGKFLQPTGKSFSVPMCTVGHWKNGVMTEEWLYWDNATYTKQIGIG
jgi:hypothetical protein